MEPITRKEQIYEAILSGDTDNLPEPLTREEAYLEAIAKNGGGGGGSDNYNALSNKPEINGVTLTGNKSASDLGLQPTLTFDDEPTENSNRPVKSGGIYSALSDKVDKVTGKDLSTNDFTDTLKTKLDGIEAGAEVNVIESISVNGVAQTVTGKAVDLDVASNLITEEQWATLGALWATE